MAALPDAETPTADIELDAERGLLRVELHGTFDVQSWMKVIERVGATEGYAPGMDALYVANDAVFEFSQDDILRLRRWIDGSLEYWGSGWRYATVAPRDYMYGMCRMISTWFDDAPFESQVFRTEAEARAWIDAGR